MGIPTISQYAESVCHPYGLFRTLDEPVCERDAYGEPVFAAGGNAAVFKVKLRGRAYALKCYIRPGKRNDAVYGYIADRHPPLLYETRYLPEELYVYDMDGTGRWYDVVLTEWGEGVSLGYALRKALHDRDRAMLARLAAGFDTLADRLLAAPWAHGDLKPGNIMVAPDGTMRLLDYDAMYLPGIPQQRARETGTPQFNHPRRDASFYCKQVDDYPAALISAALHTLAAEPSLAGAVGCPDTLLFLPQEIADRRSDTYDEALRAAARRGDGLTYRLLGLLRWPAPALPGLAEIMRFAVAGGTAEGDGLPEPFFRDGAWGYRCGTHTCIPPLFDTALEFTEGLAVVETGGFRHVIDTSGRTVIVGSGYEHIKPFANGRAAVRRNGLWSCIDRQGRPAGNGAGYGPSLRTAGTGTEDDPHGS